MSEIKRSVCDECSRPPRRLSLTMDGRLFCSKSCYMAHCGRTWERTLAETFGQQKPANVKDFKKANR